MIIETDRDFANLNDLVGRLKKADASRAFPCEIVKNGKTMYAFSRLEKMQRVANWEADPEEGEQRAWFSRCNTESDFDELLSTMISKAIPDLECCTPGVLSHLSGFFAEWMADGETPSPTRVLSLTGHIMDDLTKFRRGLFHNVLCILDRIDLESLENTLKSSYIPGYPLAIVRGYRVDAPNGRPRLLLTNGDHWSQVDSIAGPLDRISREFMEFVLHLESVIGETLTSRAMEAVAKQMAREGSGGDSEDGEKCD